MLILECWQRCYAVNKGNAKRGVSTRLKIRPCDIDLWPCKSIGFQILLRSKYVPCMVKIHWRMLILVFTSMLCGKHLTPWPLTLKINRVPDSPKDYVCIKFGQNPLKDVDSRVLTRMLCCKNLTPRPLTLKINRVSNSPKYVPSLVKIHWRMLILECSQGCYTVKIWPSDIDLWPWKSIRFQTLLRTKYVPCLVKIHWRMLILVFTRMLHSKKFTQWPWKSIGFHSPKD
jgi:hypothetical protein